MIWKFLKRSNTTKLAEPDNNKVQKFNSLEFDPDQPEFIQSPYSLFSHLRINDPLHMSKHGAWVLTRHADIVAALADHRLSNEPAFYAVLNKKNRDKYICAELANNTLPFIDGDNHKRLRTFIAPNFLFALRKTEINFDELSREVLLDLKGKLSFDLLHDFATPFSLKVLCRIFGFPETDAGVLKQWSDYFFYLFSIMPSIEIRDRTDQALQEFRTYISAKLEARKQGQGNDLISVLLRKRTTEIDFSDEELVDNCMLLFADGVGNVDSGMANMMALLMSNPDQLALLYERPELIAGAVDECLRMEAPGQFISRIASEDIEWHGKTIKKNQAVFLVLGSANRDEKVFVDADTLDIHRGNNNQALSFGKGKHGCLGAFLVRLEMQSALKVLLETYSTILLDGNELSWRKRLAHRWLESLPVTVNSV